MRERKHITTIKESRTRQMWELEGRILATFPTSSKLQSPVLILRDDWLDILAKKLGKSVENLLNCPDTISLQNYAKKHFNVIHVSYSKGLPSPIIRRQGLIWKQYPPLFHECFINDPSKDIKPIKGE